jgi:hypothetical protein
MLPAVELDDQLALPAAEVDYVRADRRLARELHAEKTPIAETGPQPALRVRLSPPQPAREVAR